MKKILLLVLVAFAINLNAQNVGIGTNNPDPSAKLDIQAVNGGILIPRIDIQSATDTTTIPAPANGLMIWNTGATFGTAGYYFNAGTSGTPSWIKVLDSGSSLDDADANPNNELQNLTNTVSGTDRTINISSGAGTTISVADNDNSTTNEIQDLSRSGNTLSLSNDASTVDLSPFLDADNLGNHQATTILDMNSNNIQEVDKLITLGTSDYDKLRVYSSSSYTFGMHSAMTFGYLNDWATTFTMNEDLDRGWLWRDVNDTQADGAMSLTTDGRLVTKDLIQIQNGILQSGNDHLGFLQGVNTDDNTYEWTGFYSGNTRQGIILYDGAWPGANNRTDEFSITAEGTNKLTLNSAGGDIALMPDGTGNVGVNTTIPNSKLHINGDGVDPSLRVQINGNSRLTVATNGGTSIGAFQDTPPANGLYVSGNVGIGVVNPTRAKLEVNGSLSTFLNYGWLNSSGNTSTASATANYSIYASDRIAAAEFNAYSDERIKNITSLSNTKEDLATLTQIQITNYSLKDTISKGNKNYKKVIAQQIKEIFPQAVTNDLKEIIPNIYKLSNINNSWISLETELIVGDRVKLIFENEVQVLEVLEMNETGFKVNIEKQGKVFVYGVEVDDFHTVDYEALSMLNISATQELLKMINNMQTEVNNFQAVFKSQEISNLDLKQTLKNQQLQIDRITELLNLKAKL